MKKCPLCREAIDEDAIKCKHCQSFLVPIQPQSADATGPEKDNTKSTVKYIVDSDLIRFGKFAFFILGLFTIVGIYLYGIDLKDVAKSQEDTKNKLELFKKELDTQQQNVNKEFSDLAQQRKALKQADDSFVTIQKQFRTNNDHAVLELNVAERTVSKDSRSAKEFSEMTKRVYDSIRILHLQGAKLVDDLVGLTTQARGAKITTSNDSGIISFNIGAEITYASQSSYGRVGIILEDAEHRKYAVCAEPIFPTTSNESQEVYVISTDKSLIPLGKPYQHSSLSPLVGLVMLENVIGQNLLGPKHPIRGIRAISKMDMLNNSGVYIYSEEGYPKIGNLVSDKATVNLQLDNRTIQASSLIVANLFTSAGTAGAVLVDKDDYALGILVGADLHFSYYFPLQEIVDEFGLRLPS